jgi:four helix bundle protein
MVNTEQSNLSNGKGVTIGRSGGYKVVMEIGDFVWNIVLGWFPFAKKTLGAQFADAADSIAFNLSEGYGRFHYKENKNFCHYSRGPAKETFTGMIKAGSRNLMTDEQYNSLPLKMDSYFRLMQGYVNLSALQMTKSKGTLTSKAFITHMTYMTIMTMPFFNKTLSIFPVNLPPKSRFYPTSNK